VPSDDGTIHGAANRDFTRAFMQRAVPVSEQGRLVDGEGKLNQDGVSRVRNAIFARAFGDSEKGLSAISRMSESTDNNVKNITNGLLAKAGQIAALKEAAKAGTRHKEFDIAPDLATAMEKYAALRESGTSVEEYIQQGNLFGSETTPFQTRVIQVFDAHKRSPKAIRSIVENFIDIANEAGDPNQQNLFGEAPEIDAASSFEAAVKIYEDENESSESEQTGLFADQGLPVRPASDGESLSNAEAESGEQKESENLNEKKKEAKPPREFSSTQINVPAEQAREIVEFAKRLIPKSELAEDGYEEDQHITAKFGTETNDVEDIQRVVAGVAPFSVTLGKISIFDTNPDFDVVKIDVESPELHAINKLIGDNLKNGDTHPVFKPHETLAYVKKGEGAKYVGNSEFEGTKIYFDKLIFSDKNRNKIEIPLTGKQQSNKETDSGNVPLYSKPTNINTAFADVVERYFAGKLKEGSNPVVMIPPPILKKLGSQSRYVTIHKAVLDKITGRFPAPGKKTHKLTKDNLLKLPEAIADPVMVFDSAQKDGSFVFVTDLKDAAGDTVLVIVKPNISVRSRIAPNRFEKYEIDVIP
ncbi:MAG TPA: 2'-5' RNA ligase family protein, partial [Pyrinomonadaceae bacterium]